MENQELNQSEFYRDFIEIKKDEKECKTCKSKKLSGNNVRILALGTSLLFLTFYGLVSLIKDVVSLFTR